MIIDDFPTSKDTLTYGDLYKLDRLRNNSHQKQAIENWHYRHYKRNDEFYIDADDLTFFHNKNIKYQNLMDMIVERLKDRGKEIPKPDKSKPNRPIPFEVAELNNEKGGETT